MSWSQFIKEMSPLFMVLLKNGSLYTSPHLYDKNLIGLSPKFLPTWAGFPLRRQMELLEWGHYFGGCWNYNNLDYGAWQYLLLAHFFITLELKYLVHKTDLIVVRRHAEKWTNYCLVFCYEIQNWQVAMDFKEARKHCVYKHNKDVQFLGFVVLCCFGNQDEKVTV